MRRIQVLMTLLLMTFAASSQAALNAYAQLSVNGGDYLDGDVTLATIGGVDVSSGYFEILEIDQSLMAKAKSGPVIFQKRVDQATPAILEAIMEEAPVDGSILIFDNDPVSGETRHRFTISFLNAQIVASDTRLPDTFDAEEANRPVVEYVRMELTGYTFRDEENNTQYTVSF
ncbi:MAG: hypothetical protein PVG42_16875 [Lysobacterales bacterium]|jgi:type VI protein secretion system component Hcp